jgi:hypothetical protein
LIWTDGQPEQATATDIHTSFRIDYRGTLALVRLTNNQPQITDYLRWTGLRANVSYGGFMDGQSVYRSLLSTPTPGNTNVGVPVKLFINEWMTRNSVGIRDPADNDQDDWIEIYNAEPFTIDLGGYYFTDDPLLNTKFRVPATGRYTVPPGGFLLVWADNETNQNNIARADLHVNFQLASSSGVIALYRPDGSNVVDQVSYGQQTPDISEGRYSDGASARFFMTKSTPRLRNSLTNSYNSAPRFPDVGQQFLVPGQHYILPLQASDPDSPEQTVTYSLLTAPAGSSYTTLRYIWFVPTNQPLGDYTVSLQGTDNGTPARSDTITFIVTVRDPSIPSTPAGPPPPVIHSVGDPNGQFIFTIDTIPGRTYRVLYKETLDAPTWTQLDRDFVAANPTASITDVITVPQRFYQVVRLD